MDFARVLNTVGDFLQRESCRHAVAGALALHAYGITRATQDLDLVTEADAQDRLVRFLESLGYETLHRSAGYSSHLHTDADLGRVDVIYIGGETSRKLFAEARGSLAMGESRVPVPRPEHLIAMKVQAVKNDPGARSETWPTWRRSFRCRVSIGRRSGASSRGPGCSTTTIS